MNSIYNFSLDELGHYFESLGDKKFRAIQIFEWLYRYRVDSFDQMTNLSKKTIEHLKENFEIRLLELEKLQVSLDGTRKYLFKLDDGHFIESVLINIFLFHQAILVVFQVLIILFQSFPLSVQ